MVISHPHPHHQPGNDDDHQPDHDVPHQVAEYRLEERNRDVHFWKNELEEETEAMKVNKFPSCSSFYSIPCYEGDKIPHIFLFISFYSIP